MSGTNTKGDGYYTVMIDTGEDDHCKIPYSVFAASDYHAARIVKDRTGHLANQNEVEGPYNRI